MIASALLLAGCPKLGDIVNAMDLDRYTPKLSFDKVTIDAIDWQGADVEFLFDVDNPNPVDVKVASFRYDLALEGQRLLQGSNDDGMELKAKGATSLALPVRLDFSDVFQTVQAVRGKDELGFDLTGAFGFATPLGSVEVPYDESGTLPALRKPKVSLKGARITDKGPLMQWIDLAIDLGVDNPNGSKLSFQQVKYDVSLFGKAVASGDVESLGDVEAGAEAGALTLPVRVSLVDAGVAIVQAVTQKEPLDLGLGASLVVDTPWGGIPLSVDEHGRVALK